MIDALGRNIDYLRISVTDRCNFRCLYCMPHKQVQWLPDQKILSYSELLQIIRAATEVGISKVRITGGEPLMRGGLIQFIQTMRNIEGIKEVCMTTNGSLLKSYALKLKNSGLDRVNVSLDTLDRQKFFHICRQDRLEQVLDGIAEAERVGLGPVKINMVVMRGINYSEILDFVNLTLAKPYQIRFIEYMPFNQSLSSNRLLVTSQEIKRMLESEGIRLIPEMDNSGGAARNYKIPGAIGTVGFISPVTNHFCAQCNRIRLTADGKVKPCLLSNEEYDMKESLIDKFDLKDITGFLKDVILQKPIGHNLENKPIFERSMFKIGG
ncbi:GTP 3',8-cyclase [Sporomusaceae bacterium FL31]|nr:GTP 3',8-cyclase [Sporomusaceae bacterium FL31]GCE35030.1 GTP 3',8-cyclase [Sporomusaceae bacterium]